MPENLDNSPFLGQFTLGKFVSAVWVLKFGQFTNFFQQFYTRKFASTIWVYKFGQFINIYSKSHIKNSLVQFGYINLDNSPILGTSNSHSKNS